MLSLVLADPVTADGEHEGGDPLKQVNHVCGSEHASLIEPHPIPPYELRKVRTRLVVSDTLSGLARLIALGIELGL